MWIALRSHVSRYHAIQRSLKPEELVTFKCHVCEYNELATEEEYFGHICRHLKNHETVVFMFEGCAYKTNIYDTFKSHKSRKHNPHTLQYFKDEVVRRTHCSIGSAENDTQENSYSRDGHDFQSGRNSDTDTDTEDLEDLPKAIEHKISSYLNWKICFMCLRSCNT